MARIPAAERRAELVAAAVRMIAAHGVEGATTRRIAQEANAPLATLHYCFDSKEVLFAAVFEHVGQQYREVLTRNDVHGDVPTTGRALLRGLLEWYVANPEFGAATVELISWAQRQDCEHGETVYNEAFATIRAILAAATTAAGRPVDATIISELTHIVSVLADGFALNWLVFTNRTAAEPQIEITVGVLDTWMAARLGDSAGSAAQPSKDSPAPTLRSLVSWVSVD
ncbi:MULTISPECIES: TetR/AcrR family transcriptional regulator [unclassified Rhodococcus (in: high G+C Gram-positive bacteria)]|uniref:TetR/AcrR family transcriptional regulator n=1 Tax=unclassified Rhodococcus (in: high G+C Gram-positive bacteria) TaxID=192944 RepID=UPI001639D603|nr:MULTISPECIES: TetR family transcriptional regulator [unclassified Rhodococcus (in: high G+C Gram-positive bacteria)]MBC2640812.1 TetR/AcrR family transcriptional regulator [Rhodococcus sp. 3A]MBC2894443.1 TetR/AcrR family transcriptional regulator [Rhodococcus sp. 4CII]